VTDTVLPYSSWRLPRRPFVSQQAVSCSRKDRKHRSRRRKRCIHWERARRCFFLPSWRVCEYFSAPRLCNLEHHMHYIKCIFVEERHSLLDKAKILYTENARKDLAHSPLLPVLSFQSKVIRRYHRAGHCDLRRRLPFSVLRRRPN